MAYFNPNQGAINDLLTSLYGQGSGQVYTSSTPESELPSQIRALRKLNALQRPMGDGGGQDVYNDFSKFDMKYAPRPTTHFSNAAKPSMDFVSHTEAVTPMDASPGAAFQGLASNVAGERALGDALMAKRLGIDSEAFRQGTQRDRAAIIQSGLGALNADQRKGLEGTKLGSITDKFLSTERERQDATDQGVANSLLDLMKTGRIYRGENGTPVRKVQKKVQDPNDPFGEAKIVEVEEPVSYTQMQMFAKAQKQGLIPENSFDFRLPHEKVTDYSGSTKHTMGFNPGNMPNYSRPAPAPAPAFRDSVNAIIPGALNSLRKIGLFSSGISPVESGIRAATGYEGKLPSDYLVPEAGSPDIASKLAALKAYFFRPNE